MTEIDFQALKPARLQSMLIAGEQILECYRVLRKANANIVGELLKGQGEFIQWNHYPKGDVFDRETHSQYYYHAHPPETREDVYGSEHGHFHTFVRPKGMPPGVKPVKLKDYKKPKGDNEAVCHLMGISMDRKGFPIRMFTTNRWVTGETWYGGRDVIRILDRFDMDHAYPSWPVNIWITAMMRLFRPQIETLILDRDASVNAYKKVHPGENVYEDRNFEVPSFLDISVDDQVAAVRATLEAA